MRVVAVTPLYHFVPGAEEKLLEKHPDAKIWTELRQLAGDELIDYCQGFDAALISMERFDDHVLSNLAELKIIGMTTAGVDHMVPDALKKTAFALAGLPVSIGWRWQR